MHAIHSNWTKPCTNANDEFFIEDFDILTTILSALKWREKNGNITMVTDSRGLDFYKSRDLCKIWNEITTELDNIPEYVDPQKFWAAGKLYALKSFDSPIAVLDTDFIVWDRIAFDKLGDITVIHREELYSDVYPDIYHFKMMRGYVFNPDFDWSLNPANTAFYVLKNDRLKDIYIKEAENFIKNTADGDNLTYMVFAEQRLLPMCAKTMDVEVGEFSTLERLFENGEKYFTHTWGMKKQMREDSALRHDFCLRCVRRIRDDFVDFVPLFSKIPEIQQYF